MPRVAVRVRGGGPPGRQPATEAGAPAAVPCAAPVTEIVSHRANGTGAPASVPVAARSAADQRTHCAAPAPGMISHRGASWLSEQPRFARHPARRPGLHALLIHAGPY